MHQYDNVILEQRKHIKQIINPFILFSNYSITYYHTIPQNDYWYIYEIYISWRQRFI
jgi:hypothetical protein